MNFFIDGAYGDYYRTAMGHPALEPARDEWEIERRKRPEPAPQIERERRQPLFRQLATWLLHRQPQAVIADR